MKKQMKTLAVAAVTASLLVACQEGKTESQSETEIQAESTEEEKTISLLGFLKPGGESPREEAAGELLKKFTEKTGYGLTTEIVGWEQIEPKLLLAVESGDPPDVAFVRMQSLSIEANADALMPLDEFIDRGLDEATKEDCLMWDGIGTYDGKKYALPMSIIPYGLYVRDDIFKEAGITEDPKTWDEFMDVAKKVNSNGASGFLLWGSAAQPAAVDYLQPMVESFGGKLLDENGKAVFDSPEALKAFHLIKDMVFDAKIVPSNVASLKYDETSDMFTAGRAAMYWDGSHRSSKYVEGIGAENLRLIPFPSETGEVPGPSYIGYWALGIPKNSKNPEIAWEYIKNFVEAENQAIYAKISGEVPIRKSAMEDEFFETDENGQRIKWFVDYVSENGTIGVAPVDFSNLSEILSLAVQQIITDENSDVEAIVKQACEEYNKDK